MIPEAPPSVPSSNGGLPSPTESFNWRDDVAVYLRGLFVFGLLVTAATVAGQVAFGSGSWPLVAMLAVQVVAAATVVALRHRPKVAAGVAIGALFAVQVTTLLHFGPVQGAGMLMALVLVIGVVYFGVRVGALLLVVGFALTAVMGLWFAEQPLGAGFDLTSPGAWLRSASITAFLGTFVLAALGVVGSAFERALAQARAAQRAERRARREQELASSALARARELEAMGRLAGGVAHDFNNSLTVLLAHSEDLLSRTLPPDVRDQIQAIEQAGRAAAATTRQLLVFGRGGPERRSVCDPVDVLSTGLKNLRRLLPEDIALDLQVVSGARVSLGAGDLLQVVVNLVLNARDACTKGGRVIVRAFPLETHVVIEVEDNGIGMDAETQKRLFEPFFTTKGERGTGLGMPMVDRVVGQAGGRMEIDSELGKGTRIRLVLPRTTATDDVAVGVIEWGSLTGRHVLVVEDEPAIQEIVRRSLEQAGARVTATSSVHEALAALETGRAADVLCTDGVLTDGTALPVIQRFQERYPKAPILLCSGHAPDELETRGLLHSRHERLPKPFTGTELVRAVGRLLDEVPSAGPV